MELSGSLHAAAGLDRTSAFGENSGRRAARKRPQTVEAVCKHDQAAAMSFQTRNPAAGLGVEVCGRRAGVSPLRFHRSDQSCSTYDLDRSLQVIGQHMQAHLGSHMGQRLGQEVC